MICVLFAHINILAGMLCTFTPIWTPLKTRWPIWRDCRNCNVTTQCGLNEGNTAQLLSMSVIAGWSIYEAC